MTTYLIRRLLQSLLILFLTSVAMYGILSLNQCGPMCYLYGVQYQTTAQMKLTLDRAYQKYGLNDPPYIRYMLWLYNWKPADANDPDYLQAELVKAQEALDVEPAGVQRNKDTALVAQVTPQLADANAKLAACQDLLNFDKLGQCLSLQRVGGILSGNWGVSWSPRRGPVLPIVSGPRLINSLELMGAALLLALLFAFPIGVYGALKQNTVGDHLLTLFSNIGLGLPIFGLAIAIILLGPIIPLFDFSVLGVTGDPQARDYSVSLDEGLRFLLVPAIVLGFPLMAGFSRFIRASLIEVLRQDYVRTAWAKGLRPRAVIFKHALRNALIPLVTRIALAIPTMIGAIVIVEHVFHYAGLGDVTYSSALNSDWPLLMGLLMVYAAMVIMSNFVADIAYGMIDPRIRYS